jgi:hypothetical protein
MAPRAIAERIGGHSTLAGELHEGLGVNPEESSSF